jgi:hypothetical protein
LSLSGKPLSPRPVVYGIPRADPKDDRGWRFSFRYWYECENFGVGQQKAGWFASLFEKLKAFSQLTVTEVLEKPDLRDKLRFHLIDWSAKKVPIQKRDIESIPRFIRESPEFELYQFQLSKGTGRVIGFFDSDMVFHIVLLDPMHNLQPSKDFNWRVTPTELSRTPFQAMKNLIVDTIRSLESGTATADVVTTLRETIGIETPSSRFIIVDDGIYEALTKAMKQCGEDCVEDLIIRIMLEGYSPQ